MKKIKAEKSEKVKSLISDAILLLDAVGIPIKEQSPRGEEKMAMAFLAVAGVTDSWKNAQSLKDGRKLKTRDIIDFINSNYEENISKGSYDDIRRKDLKLLVLADLIINSGDNPSAATNDPTRGYSLEHDFKELVASFGSKNWQSNVVKFLRLKGSLKEKLTRKKDVNKMEVNLPNGSTLNLKSNYHNSLQKSIIEEFLPAFGGGCDVLYVGDASTRILIYDIETLNSIGFFALGTEELPDVIAYNQSKNWLFLIEAVTTSGPMSEERVFEIKKLAKNCTADLIFVTAFLDRNDFRKWVQEIAWETEVWIADRPDHMVHFNGDKFLGPYKRQVL
jgi:hypothetical protein